MLKMRLLANLTVSLILCSSGSETETRELERKRKVFPSRGVIDLPFRQINGVFFAYPSLKSCIYHPFPNAKNGIVTIPEFLQGISNPL